MTDTMTKSQGWATGYGLSDEELKLVDRVREFADTVIAPAAYEYDTKRELPYDIIRTMGQMGLFGLPFPKEYGGQGKTYLQFCLAIENVSRADQSIGVTLEAGVGLGVIPIYRRGSEEQKRRWLPDLIAGSRARRIRPDRGGCRVRCRWHEDDRGSRERRVGHQRHQAVHHELGL